MKGEDACRPEADGSGAAKGDAAAPDGVAKGLAGEVGGDAGGGDDGVIGGGDGVIGGGDAGGGVAVLASRGGGTAASSKGACWLVTARSAVPSATGELVELAPASGVFSSAPQPKQNL